MPTSSRPDGSCFPAPPMRSNATTPCGVRISDTRRRTVDAFIHQVLSGLATGGIYASLALALVMIYQVTHLVNFAQGEMAMFSTYAAWSLINAGMGYWPAFLLTVLLAFALGWGLAAAVGAVAGMMIAPIVYLDPNMMGGILLYAFAAALLGGIDSPGGAVVGGFVVGVLENVLGAYVIGNDLKLSVALGLIIGVLLVRPSGFFGKVHVTRV